MRGLVHARWILSVGLLLTSGVTLAAGQSVQSLVEKARRQNAQSPQILQQSPPKPRPRAGGASQTPTTATISGTITAATQTAPAQSAVSVEAIASALPNCPDRSGTGPTPAIVPGCLNHLLHVDIRDLVDFPSQLGSTAGLIKEMLTAQPERFTGVKDATYSKYGTRGPEGGLGASSDGKEIFSVTTSHADTLKNTILTAFFEYNIVELVFDRKFVMQLVLFVHSSEYAKTNPASNGYFFKRLAIQVDFANKELERMNRLEIIDNKNPLAASVNVTSALKSLLPLNETHFKVMVDLMDRKIIMENRIDDTNPNNITMVFPVGVGSFNVRPSRADQMPVSGMADQVAAAAPVVTLTTDEFNDPKHPAKLVKNSVMNLGAYGPNTRSRIKPSYYSARPFIGIMIDGKNYTKVGFHYQIDGAGLTRGFVSHGCLRVRDLNLYVLDAIVNEGPHNELDVTVANHIFGYEPIDHPMPKVNDWYNAVVYSSVPMEKTHFECPEIGTSYDIKYVGPFHTLSDPDDCLFLVDNHHQPAEIAIAYFLKLSATPPPALINNNPNIEGASEGGEEYKVQKREKKCALFGLFCKEVRETTYEKVLTRPGPNASAAEVSQYAADILKTHSDKFREHCIPNQKRGLPDGYCKGQQRYIDFMSQCYPRAKPGIGDKYCTDLQKKLNK